MKIGEVTLYEKGCGKQGGRDTNFLFHKHVFGFLMICILHDFCHQELSAVEAQFVSIVTLMKLIINFLKEINENFQSITSDFIFKICVKKNKLNPK